MKRSPRLAPQYRHWTRLGNYSDAQLNEMGRDNWRLVSKVKVGKELNGERIYEYTFVKEVRGEAAK